MNKTLSISLLAVVFAYTAEAQDAKITIQANQGTNKIKKEIYGQFAEHLGSCIYGGLWVGKNSPIPNTDGYRNDVLQALKELQVPVLRWPGGCFADEYHWRDGIGPTEERPKLQNNNWGGTIEDNSFGTHEFLNLCELIGAEPYISGNVGSGSVQELAQWVEYMTSDANTPMANLRRKNGREKAWNVKYLGIGNESWGCGGNMTPEYYSDLYRRYAIYCRNFGNNQLYKVASGASDYDYTWTKVLMNKIGSRMNGISLHYYTVKTWEGSKGSATIFNDDEYYRTLGKCLEIEDVINKHCAIMDEKDPDKKVDLLVDEWGTWWDEEPGTIRGHLYQQNTMRDAFVAALSLNIFQRHTDRIKMANIAQIVNVLQSMILTDTKGSGHMVLTPTYHIFNMYKPFQESTYLPLETQCGNMKISETLTIPTISTSAAKTANGQIVVSIANIDLQKQQEIEIKTEGYKAKNVIAQILTSKNITDYNDFSHPETIKPTTFKNISIRNGNIKMKIPAKSIVVLRIS